MTQQEIAQELNWAGLGEMSDRKAEIREFEAYGDGRLNVAHVLALGVLKLYDGSMKLLYSGQPKDDEEINALLTKYGHYAAC